MIKRYVVGGFLLALTIWLLRSAPASFAQAHETLGLESVFSVANGGVRDTNGDGLADAVVARVIVAAKPSREDVAGATTIAARLGYETSALTLPIVVRDNDIAQPATIGLPILIGRENEFVKKLVAQGTLDITALKPGQGLVAVVRSPLGGPDGVVVVGGDDTGTLAAAIELGARLPRVWAMAGTTLDSVTEGATKYLQSKGLSTPRATVPSILVDSDRRGIARLTVQIQVADGEVARAAAAIKDLDSAHHRGQEGKVLDFQNAAETAFDIVAGGKVQAHAAVGRSGLNPRTLTPPIDPDELATDSPGNRGAAAAAPSGAAQKSFDLSNAYSIEGWFGDAYADLIPDRTDTTVLIGDAAESVGAGQIAARLGLESTGSRPADRPVGRQSAGHRAGTESDPGRPLESIRHASGHPWTRASE